MTANTATAIMDAAERRIRSAGYHGFSFRELALDVGIRSASVHHHFPAKADLAAAVARRYARRVLDELAAAPQAEAVAAARDVFRRALQADGRMCLCGALGAEATSLPPEVLAEAQAFFRGILQFLADPAGGADQALRVLSLLEGAMLVARTLGDVAAFDRATAAMI